MLLTRIGPVLGRAAIHSKRLVTDEDGGGGGDGGSEGDFVVYYDLSAPVGGPL